MAAVVPKLTPTPVFKAPVVPFHKREQVKVRSLGLVAKMIGATVGVEIVFDPKITTAATDCRTKIFLPVLTDTGTEEDAELLKGLVLHEAAHCAETDPEISQTCMKESGPLGNALRNMYEDGRIEKAQALVYPGIPPMIDKALQVLVKRGVYEKPKAEEEPLSAVTGLLISGLRTKYLDQSGLAEHYPLWRNMCVKLLGDKVTRALWRVAMEVKGAKSNDDSYAMAKKTLEILKDMAEGKEPEEPDNGDPSDDDPCDGEAGPNGQPQQDQGQDQGQQPDPNGQDKGKGKGQQSSGANEPSTEEKKKNAQSILDSTKEEVDEQKVDFGKAADQGLEESGAKESNPYGRGAGSGRNDVGKRIEARHLTDQIIDRSRQISVRLGNELEALLEAKMDTDVYWSRNGRKLDATRLARIAVGNYGVFKHRDEREGLNTAFCLMTDISGSMDSWGYSSAQAGGSPLQVAEDAMWAILQAVDRFDGVKTSAAAFGTSIHPIKGYEENFRSARHFLWDRASDSGGTDTHYAVQHMARELLGREEERKLMLVITDGMPSSVDATAAAMGEVLRGGGEVAMLFIASDESAYAGLKNKMAKSGATFAVVSSSDQLVRGVFEAIKTAL